MQDQWSYSHIINNSINLMIIQGEVTVAQGAAGEEQE